MRRKFLPVAPNSHELRTIQERYALRASQRRASADIADVARAATYGLVDTVLVDIDEVVPGHVDGETGAITIDDADDAVNYGVVDEIARRVWRSGRRCSDLPGFPRYGEPTSLHDEDLLPMD